MFYVALAYPRHQDYERSLGRYSCSSFANTHFKKWQLGVHVEEVWTKQESLHKKLDAAMAENMALKKQIAELEKQVKK